MDTKPLYSDWTAKEWVQFLPAVDSLIPNSWRKEVAINNHVTIKSREANIELEGDLPVFDSGFENKMQRFLILTEKVYDIGGQICEKYVATYFIEHAENGKEPKYSIDGPDPADLTNVGEGFIRMMLIRTFRAKNDPPDIKESVWGRLFGDSATKNRPDFKTIQNDPTAALPLISERIPFKLEIVNEKY